VIVTPPPQTQPQPVQQPPEDDLKPPGFLQRQPEQQAPPAQPVAPPPPTAPAPGTQEVMPPAAQAPTLPAGMTLPPGMTPEMAAAFMAQMQPKTTSRGRGRPRTPAVQPTNMDSSQTQQEAQPAAAQPTMVNPSGPPPAPQANGAAAPDAAVSSIMSTVKNLL
jgi:hypothetical protein